MLRTLRPERAASHDALDRFERDAVTVLVAAVAAERRQTTLTTADSCRLASDLGALARV